MAEHSSSSNVTTVAAIAAAILSALVLVIGVDRLDTLIEQQRTEHFRLQGTAIADSGSFLAADPTARKMLPGFVSHGFERPLAPPAADALAAGCEAPERERSTQDAAVCRTHELVLSYVGRFDHLARATRPADVQALDETFGADYFCEPLDYFAELIGAVHRAERERDAVPFAMDLLLLARLYASTHGGAHCARVLERPGAWDDALRLRLYCMPTGRGEHIEWNCRLPVSVRALRVHPAVLTAHRREYRRLTGHDEDHTHAAH